MQNYHDGGGTRDLADTLEIQSYQGFAKSGSCNDRIIRTVLRDCFATMEPTFYIVGLTFLHRYEIPIRNTPADDGLWESCPGKSLDSRSIHWRSEISLDDYNFYSKLRTHMFYLNESLEKTMYQTLSMIHTVKNLGHKILVFNTAEFGVDDFLSQSRFQLLNNKHIVESYRWRSIQYQLDCGAKFLDNDSNLEKYIRHVAPGEHRWLNEFLTKYIQENKILQ
jgi:hypothetical protein